MTAIAPPKSVDEMNSQAKALVQRLIDSHHNPADGGTVLVWALAMLFRRVQQTDPMCDREFVASVSAALSHALCEIQPASGLIVRPM